MYNSLLKVETKMKALILDRCNNLATTVFNLITLAIRDQIDGLRVCHMLNNQVGLRLPLEPQL